MTSSPTSRPAHAASRAPSPTSRALRLVPAIAALAFLSLPLAAAGTGDRPTVESILARADQPDAPSPQLLAQDLIDLGTTAFPKAFDALVLEARQADGLSSRRARVVFAACSIAGPVRWRPIVEARATRGAAEATFQAAYALCGACGTSSEIDLLLHTVVLDDPAVENAEFQRASTDILLRDTTGFTTLDALVGTVPLRVQSALASGVESTKRPEAATMLARWIGTRRELRLVALPHLSRLALALEKPFPEEVLQPVRTLLEQVEGETLPDAIICAGRLGDYAAIPHLARWLRDGDAGVKADALWSLRQISGLVLDEDPSRWQSWYASESSWWDNDSRAAFESLRSGTRIEKVDALRAIAGLHAWRDKLAEHVALLLDDQDVELAGYAARMLGRLGSRATVGPLLEALANPGCAQAAHGALEAITKKKLPLDPAACRDALGVTP
jgi:hypothetical protein